MIAAGLARAERAGAVGALDALAHDASDLYVLERPEELGGEAIVRLRVPHASAADEVRLRYVVDGEPRVAVAALDEQNETEAWWLARFPLGNPAVRYRWLLTGGRARYRWLNGAGSFRHDVPDADDFVVGIDPGGPDWHLRSVVYEIFPDRFERSGAPGDAPSWAVPCAWEKLPTGRGRATPVEWYGGDLPGVERRLDHVQGLGASVLYLTPFFPARSTHRYDATSFDAVDPLLGGDSALTSLVRAAHARGIRVVGDLTLNHVGVEHAWFCAARTNAAARERRFFFFGDRFRNGYASWIDVPSLPKLDWASPELRRRMREVVQRWLRGPDGLDGWRIDVANMTGRLGAADRTADVARLVRAAAVEVKPDALVIAEHGHDFRRDLAPGGWHGAMNYSGFLRPVWWWLRRDGWTHDPFLEAPAPLYDGGEAVATMRAFRAGVPWSAVLHSWTLLDSHDTPRFRTVTGSRERQMVGVGLQMTTPGVPMIFAGDELALEGEWGEDARRPMPWNTRDAWDEELLATYRELIALRRSSDALARGGLRYAYVDDDVIAYLRETAGERLLCFASRGAHEPVRLPARALGATAVEPVFGAEASVAGDEVVLPADGPAFHIWRLEV